jgi:type I restriction enzyme, S subunit
VVSTPKAVTTDGAWHGAVPAGWSLKQLKWAVTFQRGHDLPAEDRQAGPIPVVTGGGTTGWHNVAQARGPGIVTGRYGTIGEFYLVEQDYWPLNTSLYSIDLHGNHAGFLRYMLEPLAPLFHLNAAKSAVPGIDRSDIHTIPVAVPPLATQHAIADYLDRETARLDGLVAANERVLGLVTERRRALITRAVTRGLDPCAPLRDSGIPWLGEIPAHWETERTRWLFRERDDRSETGEEDLLTVSHLTGVTLRSEKDVNMFEAETTEGYKICLAGDLVINTLWAWMGAMGVSPINGIVSPAYNVYQPKPRLDPNFVDALVRIPVFAQEVTRYSKGVWSSRLRLYPEGFFEVFCPVPPLDEQRAIVAHIAKETAKLDALRASTERTIALLKERRSALIAAAVTGQIEVEGAKCS